MLLNGAVRLYSGFDLRVVDVPEVALGIHELDAYLALAALLRAHVDDAAFALFLGEAIHHQDGLAALEIGVHGQSGAMRVDIEGVGLVAKGQIVVGAPVNNHGNMQRKSTASADVAA